MSPASEADVYEAKDQLSLWWLGEPMNPVRVGQLNLVRALRCVSLRYDDAWIERGFALSEDLPLLLGQEFIPTQPETAAGAVDDARPDRWGERVIRFLDRPPRLSLLEYLYFAGDDRFGALGVSASEQEYRPRRFGPLPTLEDAEAIFDLVRKVLANEPIAPELKRLISPGATLGGAHPKALLEVDGEQWVVKFSDADPVDTPLIEHATMTLARGAQIHTADTFAIPLTYGHAVAIRRFDRQGTRRVHAISANVALRAAQEPMGYPELAQLMRRRGAVADGRHVKQMRELFRRMVFNILMDNTDDHEKNHALLMTDAAEYELAPAYDVLPAGQALGFQQMRVGQDGADSTLENALSMCDQFSLKLADARLELHKVATVVDDWRAHFRAHSVSQGDIDLLAEQIDRPFLSKQRHEALRGVSR